MPIEAVSEIDSISNAGWEEIETVSQWNGRDLNSVHRQHHENRISAVALQRARFDNSQTGYVLCRNERDSDDKVLRSDEDTKKSHDKESETEVKNSTSIGVGYDRDDHGHSSQSLHVKHKTRINFENGNNLEISGKLKHEHRNDRNEISDRTSGEIDASWNY